MAHFVNLDDDGIDICSCGYDPRDPECDDADNVLTGTSKSCPTTRALWNHVTFPSFSGLSSLEAPSEEYISTLDNGAKLPIRHWCFIGDVLTVNPPMLRSRTTVRTRFNEKADIAWYVDNGEVPRGLRPGSTVCIMYAQRKMFMEGSLGIRHDQSVDFSFAFNCPFVELQSEANHLLRNFREDSRHCFVCEKSTKSNCGKCKLASYCSVECQKGSWQTHKKVCPDEDKLLGLALLPYIPFDRRQLTFPLLAELALEVNNQAKGRAANV